MGTFIRRNLTLIAGIVLPVLLVAGFLVLSRIPQALFEPPRQDFLLVSHHYERPSVSDYLLEFEVRDGRLYGKAVPAKNEDSYPARQQIRIFRYLAPENRFDEIAVQLPEALDRIDEPTSFIVEETRQLRLDQRAKSKDGYSFEHVGYDGRGGLLGELFGMNRRHDSNYVLSIDGHRVDLPRPAGVPGHQWQDLRFLGWVVAADNAR